MTRQRRSFSASEKLAIIDVEGQFGIYQTLREDNLSHSELSMWGESYN
jgi:putative transposase